MKAQNVDNWTSELEVRAWSNNADKRGRAIVSEQRCYVVASDANYVVPLAVTLRSLADVVAVPEQERVVVFSDGISPEDQARIRSSCAPLTLEFIDVQTKLPTDLPLPGYFTRSTYSRLLIGDLVDGEIERVIYLDCDVVVADDPTPLFSEDLEGCTVAATADQDDPTVGCPHGLLNWRQLGMDPKTPMFNAGVMVIDLQRWRATDMSARVFTYLRDHHAFVRFADQDALNAILCGEFKLLPLRWNQQPPLRRASPPFPLVYPFFPLGEIDSAIDDPAIIHFSTLPKPWHRNCRDVAAPRWREVVLRTSWSDWELPPPPPLWHRAVRRSRKAIGRRLPA